MPWKLKKQSFVCISEKNQVNRWVRKQFCVLNNVFACNDMEDLSLNAQHNLVEYISFLIKAFKQMHSFMFGYFKDCLYEKEKFSTIFADLVILFLNNRKKKNSTSKSLWLAKRWILQNGGVSRRRVFCQQGYPV